MSFARDVLGQLTPPCKDITRLLSESMDRTLPLALKIKLHVHLLICEGCRRYREQLAAIRQALRQSGTRPNSEAQSPSQGAPPDAQDRLKRALEERRR